MLDITTNQASASISNLSYCGYGIADEAAAAAELLLDEEMMDPLFEEDWLHENNLDILFDLFEEEIENKVGTETSSSSSTLFGTSPVTSYLFGTSPSLASALDLIYLDNQQPSISNNNVASMSTTASASSPLLSSDCSSGSMTIKPAASLGTTTVNSPTMNQVVINHAAGANISKPSTYNVGATTRIVHNINGNAQQVNQVNTAQTLTNSITNAMRIKRGLKKGQSEGVSLLAKPCSSNNVRPNGNNSGSSGNISSNNSKSNSKSTARKTIKLTSKNFSDKTSAKITNFKSSIIIGNTSNNKNIENNRIGTDINYSKQSQQQSRDKYYLHKCQQHVHYITGRAVIHEHAYAVRGL